MSGLAKKSEPILKRYEDFCESLNKTIDELQREIEAFCRKIGCKTNGNNFIDCTKSCPLFYAWSHLENLKDVNDGERQK